MTFQVATWREKSQAADDDGWILQREELTCQSPANRDNLERLGAQRVSHTHTRTHTLHFYALPLSPCIVYPSIHTAVEI
jgi:hypothetical protein